jgi:hypothetical protein
MTKRQLAEAVKQFELAKQINPAKPDLYKSSLLPVALEFLGELNKEQLEYSRYLFGVRVDEIEHLVPPELRHLTTLRGILLQLPD